MDYVEYSHSRASVLYVVLEYFHVLADHSFFGYDSSPRGSAVAELNSYLSDNTNEARAH